MYNAIRRSAESVLHRANLPREDVARLGRKLAVALAHPGNYAQAVQRYNATDEFDVGEQAAREYLHINNIALLY